MFPTSRQWEACAPNKAPCSWIRCMTRKRRTCSSAGEGYTRRPYGRIPTKKRTETLIGGVPEYECPLRERSQSCQNTHDTEVIRKSLCKHSFKQSFTT